MIERRAGLTAGRFATRRWVARSAGRRTAANAAWAAARFPPRCADERPGDVSPRTRRYARARLRRCIVRASGGLSMHDNRAAALANLENSQLRNENSRSCAGRLRFARGSCHDRRSAISLRWFSPRARGQLGRARMCAGAQHISLGNLPPCWHKAGYPCIERASGPASPRKEAPLAANICLTIPSPEGHPSQRGRHEQRQRQRKPFHRTT
jgi:hypothetical protein